MLDLESLTSRDLGLSLLTNSCSPVRKLTQLYVQVLLADQDAADEVWAFWDAGEGSDAEAAFLWLLIALQYQDDKQPKMNQGLPCLVHTEAPANH